LEGPDSDVEVTHFNSEQTLGSIPRKESKKEPQAENSGGGEPEANRD